ncbi:MAG: T9SS type A sorting domain-containing protein [Bacteroidales bacterium]|jgi:hypothetical protein|nr:T9SS type A sorting domain-containing protein [Bacteroidales bacterium]
MKRVPVLLIVLAISSFVYSQEASVQFPQLWMRADSVGNELEQNIWRDISGNNNHGKLIRFSAYGQLEELNYNPAIKLTDSVQIRVDSILTISDNITVMLVYHVSDSLREENVWQIGDTSTESRAGQTTQQIVDNYGTNRFSETNNKHAVISTQTQIIRSTNEQYNLTLGRFDTLTFNGKIAEVLFFSGIEHDSITKIWEAYLAIKYGVTLYGRSYYNSIHDSVWNYFGNENLSGQIIGIGKDEYFGLHQKQSITTDEKIIFGADTSAWQTSVTGSNTGNQPEMNNLQFIILGMDTIAFKEKTEIHLENGFTLTKYGAFRVQKTGIQAIPTFMEINYSDFEIDTTFLTSLHLLINREEDEYVENFDFYPPEYIDTVNKVLIFKNIYWDVDNNGSDLFYIALLTPDSTMNYAILNENEPGDSLLSYIESINPADAVSNLPKCITCSTNEGNISNTNNKNQNSDNTINPCVATVYPNPSVDGHFEVVLQFTEETEATVSIINQEGKVIQVRSIKNQSVYNEPFEIKTRGEYQVKIQAKTELQLIKIIVI